eukprot:1804785-Rhodomonas_salina.1
MRVRVFVQEASCDLYRSPLRRRISENYDRQCEWTWLPTTLGFALNSSERTKRKEKGGIRPGNDLTPGHRSLSARAL